MIRRIVLDLKTILLSKHNIPCEREVFQLSDKAQEEKRRQQHEQPINPENYRLYILRKKTRSTQLTIELMGNMRTGFLIWKWGRHNKILQGKMFMQLLSGSVKQIKQILTATTLKTITYLWNNNRNFYQSLSREAKSMKPWKNSGIQPKWTRKL